MTLDTKALRALLAKASPRPWKASPNGTYVLTEGDDPTVAMWGHHGLQFDWRQDNEEANALEALLDRVNELEKELSGVSYWKR